MPSGILPFGTVVGSSTAARKLSRSPWRKASSIRRNFFASAQRSSSVAISLGGVTSGHRGHSLDKRSLLPCRSCIVADPCQRGILDPSAGPSAGDLCELGHVAHAGGSEDSASERYDHNRSC